MHILLKTTLLSSVLMMASQSALAADSFYVVTNKADGNSVVGFEKSDEGKFLRVGEYFTGGLGTGDLEIPALKKDPTHPLANGDDPLISANAIAEVRGGYIVAVNPGSGSISLMKQNEDKTLKVINTVKTSDKFPISLASHRDVIVVASVGLTNNEGSISSFKVKNGELVEIESSRRDLKARPSTIDFSTNGKYVIVNELVTGKIHTFSNRRGKLSEVPVSTIESPISDGRFQAIPVGFDIAKHGDFDVVFMSEARFLTPDFKLRPGKGEVVQSPLYSWQTGSVSTYKLDRNGGLSLISSDILTGNTVEGGEIANCWVALSKDGTILYAVNALSSSISAFDVKGNGEVVLKHLTAYKDTSEADFYSDVSISDDGKQLYQLVGNRGKVKIFDIQPDGTLKPNHSVSGLPQLGSYGMITN